jgi:hypothetical protein
MRKLGKRGTSSSPARGKSEPRDPDPKIALPSVGPLEHRRDHLISTMMGASPRGGR